MFPCLYIFLWLLHSRHCTAFVVAVSLSMCIRAIARLIASYHYYWRCRIDWLSARSRQTGTYWVVISFNSSWIAQRCVFWKVCSPCVCVSVSGGYEADLLFPGQLLVTQEWLICNGCCHSPAVAPGDGCAVTNAHTLVFQPENTHTTQKFKNTHQYVCAHADSLTYKESSIPPVQCYDSRQALQHQSSVQPQVTDR